MMATRLINAGSVILFYIFIIIAVILLNYRMIEINKIMNEPKVDSKIINVAYNR